MTFSQRWLILYYYNDFQQLNWPASEFIMTLAGLVSNMTIPAKFEFQYCGRSCLHFFIQSGQLQKLVKTWQQILIMNVNIFLQSVIISGMSNIFCHLISKNTNILLLLVSKWFTIHIHNFTCFHIKNSDWASRGLTSIWTKRFAFVFDCHFKCGLN